MRFFERPLRLSARRIVAVKTRAFSPAWPARLGERRAIYAPRNLQRFPQLASVHPYRYGAPVTPSRPRYRIDRGDAVTWLCGLPDASVDLVITDPPYESLEKHRAIGTTTRLTHSKASSNDWFQIFPNARFEDLFREVWRVLRDDTHFYLLCDAETMFVAKPTAERVGFKFWKPIVWNKVSIGMGYHYRARYEMILFFEKGKRKLADLAISDIIDAPRIRNGYPAEKPVAVSEVLVTQSSEPSEVVVDPFMGSGSAGVAAVKNGRHFWGNDLCAEAVAITEARLKEAGAVADTGARGPGDVPGAQLGLAIAK
jgi:site-specific DNA-methyltransferase (adenine-specific)